MSVAGQIRAEEVPGLAAQGVKMIVNNRPDGEEPGQPAGAEIEAAARAAGVDYRHIPVESGFSAEQVAAMARAMDEAKGPVLAFCRSGTRSAFLWALASRGREPAHVLVEKAKAAGYDLSPIAAHLG